MSKRLSVLLLTLVFVLTMLAVPAAAAETDPATAPTDSVVESIPAADPEASSAFTPEVPAEEPAEEPAEDPAAESPVAETGEITDEAPAAYAADTADGFVINNDGTYSYYQGGVMVTDQVIAVDGKYYGFDYRGIMYTDTTFELYSSALGRWVNYRATADGSLYVNSWYVANDNSRYYYGESGAAPSGVYTVDGIQYCFGYYGELVTSGFVSGYDYVADKNGHAHPLNHNGWTEVEGKWYYLQNRTPYQNKVALIDGNYYAFDSNAHMYAGTAFYLYTREHGSQYYRAAESGVLYVNSWYLDEAENQWYYYGDMGKAPVGLVAVNGVNYIFGYGGCMATNYMTQVDGIYYVADANGNITPVTEDGWVSVGNTWYYIQDGVKLSGTIATIDGVRYGFQPDGIMLAGETDEFFSHLYDPETNSSHFFRARETGILYVNEWYQDSNKNWWYYGEGGRHAEGLTNIGGVNYLFSYNGQLITDSSTYLEGVYYISNKDGVAYAIQDNAWTLADGKWYYMENSELFRNKLANIGGTNYVFNYDGTMLDNNETIDVYNDELGDWVFYRAHVGGTLYVNEWYQDVTGDWFYYNAAGQAYRGPATVDGVLYLFNYDGSLQEDSYSQYDGNWYVSDANGYAYLLNNNAWTYAGGNYYYVQDGEILQNTVAFLGGAYYGFDYDGTMYANTEFYTYDEETSRSYRYRADATGALYVNRWFSEGSDWFFYGPDGKAVSGVFQISGTTYVFSEYGYMLTNTLHVDYATSTTYWIDGNGIATAYGDGWHYIADQYEEYWIYVYGGTPFDYGLLNVGGVNYLFGNARLVENGIIYLDSLDGFVASDASGALITTPGWHTITYGDYGYYGYTSSTEYIYIKDTSGLLYEGWLSNGAGGWYYLWPELAHNTIVKDGSSLYIADTNGLCTAISGDGFYGDCYVLNGTLLQNTWQLIDGNWYYFHEDGYKAFGSQLIDNANYFFADDGVMQDDGWIYYGSSRYYAQPSGVLLTGMQTIGGNTYYFRYDGLLITDDYVEIDGVYYSIDHNGIVTAVGSEDGWHYVNGHYYYIQYNELLCNYIITIDGHRYGFDDDGVMLTNVCDYGYYFGADGTAQSGWIYANGSWLYGNPNDSNQLVSGRWEIGGKTYYFLYGYELQIGTFVYDNKVIITDNDGAVVSELNIADGWSYAEGQVLYYQNGKPYTGWVGDYYVEYGAMLRDGFYYLDNKYYCFDFYGKCYKNTWISETYSYSDESYYTAYYLAREDGSLYRNEWLYSGGTWYYFDGFQMVDYDCWIDGKLEQFDASGRYLGTRYAGTSQDGWVYVDGIWYFYYAGERLVGSYLIDGNWYYFYSDGSMASNAFIVNFDDTYYYYDHSGVRAAYTGWQMMGDNWVYFNEDHIIPYGWINDNGSLYFQYDLDGIIYGYHVIDGKLYYFNAAGICEGTRGVVNGWFNADGEWYFFEDGKLAEGVRVMGGTTYFFSEGLMVTDTLIWETNGYYYYNSSGVREVYHGWRELWGGTVYFDEYGRVVDGVRVIDGKVVYLDDIFYVN